MQSAHVSDLGIRATRCAICIAMTQPVCLSAGAQHCAVTDCGGAHQGGGQPCGAPSNFRYPRQRGGSCAALEGKCFKAQALRMLQQHVPQMHHHARQFAPELGQPAVLALQAAAPEVLRSDAGTAHAGCFVRECVVCPYITRSWGAWNSTLHNQLTSSGPLRGVMGRAFMPVSARPAGTAC